MRWAVIVSLMGWAAAWSQAAEEEGDRSHEFARSLIKRWLWESGGSKKIQDVAAIQMTGSISTLSHSVPMVQVVSRDGYFLQEFHYPNGRSLREVVTPDGDWFEHSELGVGVMRPEESSERLRWFSPWLALDWELWYRSARKLKDQQFEGRFSNVAELELVGGGTEKWYLDFTDGMLHTMVRPGTPQRAGAALRIDAWREIDGFAIPRRMTRFDPGSKVELERDEIQVLDAVPLAQFQIDEKKRQDAVIMAEAVKRYHEAIGGDTMLATVRSRVIRQNLHVLTSGVNARIISYRKFPNFALDVKHVEGIGTTWTGFSGKQAWEFSEITGFRLLEGAERQQMLGEADLLSAARLGAQLRLVSDYRREETAAGVQHVARLSNLAQPVGEFYFNDETGFLDKLVSGVVGPGGGLLQVEVTLEDYREYDGVWLPTRVHTLNPAIETVMEIESVQHNVELPDELFFARPEGVDYFPEYSRWEEESAP